VRTPPPGHPPDDTPTHASRDPEPGARAGIVVVAAGAGTRLGHGMPKALVPLAGRSLLVHALDGVLASGIARQVVVVVPPGDTELTAICRRFSHDAGRAGTPPVRAVAGGASRSDSVIAGLKALDAVDFVLVHDAARCLAPETVFVGVVAALAAGASAVVPAVPVVDTIKTVAATGAAGDIGAEIVTGTPERAALRAVQTPQGFRLAELLAAHARFEGTDATLVTDDAMLMELAGARVHVVPGSVQALKITTPVDLLLAEALVANGYVAGHEEKP
jgi:2-C-methyl-D-erythritol 4-phosphate cytidylyltransferase